MWKAAFFEMAAAMDAGAVVYCFMPQGGDQMMMMMMMMMMGAGIEPRHEIIWLKNNHVLGRVDYAYKHEPILYAWKEGGHKFYGDFQTSILEYPKPQISDLHPTQKPVALIERLVSNSSRQSEIVYDPFLGSGTTLIACENLNRRCRAIELDPGYVGVTLERYFQATGIKPVLLSE
jgi:DNA modification methylase